MHLSLEGDELSIREQTILIMFLDHCFNSLVSIQNTYSSIDTK